MVQCSASTSQSGKIPPRNCQDSPQRHFWFFLQDEEFASRTISDGSVDLDKFPTNWVCQLAKRMESSKATVHHIKQVAQINLLRHQCTELPKGKYKKKKLSVKSKQSNHKWHDSEGYQVQNQYKRWFDAKSVHQNKDRCSECGDTAHIEGFQCSMKKYQCKACHKFGHFTSLCFQKIQACSKPRRPKVHQLQAGTVYVKESAVCGQSEEDSTSEDSFCLQVKIKCTQADSQKIPRPIHLITNLAFRLKPHHTRNLYLRARFDTCADVNLMPASVYKLVFQDPNMKNLAPSSLEIGTFIPMTLSRLLVLVYSTLYIKIPRN